LRIRPEGVSRLREDHAAAAPDEQGGADLGLEGLDPRRQCRLRDRERLGRAADVPAFGDLEERLDLGELQGPAGSAPLDISNVDDMAREANQR
jgi:hypothetical protein